MAQASKRNCKDVMIIFPTFDTFFLHEKICKKNHAMTNISNNFLRKADANIWTHKTPT